MCGAGKKAYKRGSSLRALMHGGIGVRNARTPHLPALSLRGALYPSQTIAYLLAKWVQQLSLRALDNN